MSKASSPRLSCGVPQATAGTRILVWALYVAHQVSVWALIWLAQTETHEYSDDLRWFNFASLAVNALFHLLHLAQTHWTYDGLAQDAHESSSQASVIMLLCFALLMEYKQRGLFMGWPSDPASAWRLPSRPIELVRKYHGYAFAWAAIYTFWYHPMESTVGHAFGFAHTAFFMVQGSLMLTRAHLNKWWRLLLEIWVAIHGGVVAAQTGGDVLWPMFS